MNKNEQNPILVNNPATGREVNVAPLIELAEKCGVPTLAEVEERIDKAIELISCWVNPEAGIENVQQTIFFLYKIRDAFKQSTEPEKK
jgi:hypothetical protein